MPRDWARADKATFRQKLIEDVSLTRFARLAPTEELATSLGVTLDVLVHASKLARAGFAPAEAHAKFRKLEVFVALGIAAPIVILARRTRFLTSKAEGTGSGQMARALMHAAMQTRREPNNRSHGQWGPLEGCEDARYRLMAGQKDRTTQYHTTTAVTEGLYRAIELRARAYGATRHRYVNLWLADLVDGLLAELVVVPVTRWQLFGDARAYVLPLSAAPAPEQPDPGREESDRSDESPGGAVLAAIR